MREVVFGLQDGVTSILAVVSVVAAASNDTYTVLISGIAATLAEVFSMGAGEYMSSKSQREIFNAQIASERSEVEERPGEAEAEVAFMFEREGLSEASSRRIAAEIAQDPNVLLRTMVEKELGLALEEGGSALQGAAILAGAFFVAALVPLVPYFFFPVRTGSSPGTRRSAASSHWRRMQTSASRKATVSPSTRSCRSSPCASTATAT